MVLESLVHRLGPARPDDCEQDIAATDALWKLSNEVVPDVEVVDVHEDVLVAELGHQLGPKSPRLAEVVAPSVADEDAHRWGGVGGRSRVT